MSPSPVESPSIMATPTTPSTPNQHGLPPIPPSPTQSFASTAFPAASLNLPPPPAPLLPKNVLSRSDVAASITAYESLLDSAKVYRKAIVAVAAAASSFGAALESCARCKGAGDTAEGLMNAGGLQHLIASNTHILSECLYRGFEVPLLHELDNYKEKTAENEERYKREVSEKSNELRKREKDHLKLARQRKWSGYSPLFRKLDYFSSWTSTAAADGHEDLSAFRNALVDLTRQIDELDNLKYTHYRSGLSLAQDTSTRILDSSALVVRAEIEIFEKIAQKGWDSSGGLDDLISRSADPFAPEAGSGSNGEGEIFSILPSHSILPSPQGPGMICSGSIIGGSNSGAETGGGAGGGEGKYQSLTGALSHNGDFDEYEDDDERSIFSGGFSNPGALNSAGGGGRGKIGIPPFSPSASSAGWGITGNQKYGSTNPDIASLALPPPLDEIDERPTTPEDDLLNGMEIESEREEQKMIQCEEV